MLIPKGRTWPPAARAAAIMGVVSVVLLLVVLDAAHGQTNPFLRSGPATAAAPPPDTGVTGWILHKQAEFYRQLSGLVRQTKADGSAVWGLLGLSFLYGVFHAAGPGHGKAVISSYMVANEETWRRGVVLSAASSMLQALTAVVIVAVAAILLRASAAVMTGTVRWIEIASYLLIAAFGARLVWVKGRALVAHAAGRGAVMADAHQHDHTHKHHGHDHSHEGHVHGPTPRDVAGPGGWRRGLAAVISVGLRPCSGAILVLVFSLAQGLFWAGVGATFVMGAGTAITVAAIATLAVTAKQFAGRLSARSFGTSVPVLLGLETAAALLVMVFGLALLGGYMASERMAGF